MKISNLLIALCLQFSSAEALSDQAYDASVDRVAVNIPKRVIEHSESPYFEKKLTLPMNSQGGVEIPLTFDEGARQVRDGLDPAILKMSISAFNEICKARRSCKISSPDFWNRFNANTDNHLIADISKLSGKNYALSDYLAALKPQIGRAYQLDAPCSSGESICAYMNERMHTSSAMYGSMLFRKALLDTVGRPATLCDIARSMGDLVEYKEAFKKECKSHHSDSKDRFLAAQESKAECMSKYREKINLAMGEIKFSHERDALLNEIYSSLPHNEKLVFENIGKRHPEIRIGIEALDEKVRSKIREEVISGFLNAKACRKPISYSSAYVFLDQLNAALLDRGIDIGASLSRGEDVYEGFSLEQELMVLLVVESRSP